MSLNLNLFRLQQADTQCDRINSRLTTILNLLQDNKGVMSAAARHQESLEAIARARTQMDEADATLTAHRIKLEQLEASLYSSTGHSPKELQDLQNDITSMRKYTPEHENRLLESMQIYEDCQSAVADALSAKQAAESRSESGNSALIAEQKDLKKQLDSTLAERTAILASIPTSEQEMYSDLRQRKRGIAVAKVEDNGCSICGAGMTAAQIQEIKQGKNLSHCPTCGRILFAA